MVSVRQVAQKAGVSAVTVSRVVNDRGNVTDSTRQRVNEAIRELNYIPNAAARSLKGARTGLIALLTTDISSPFFSSVARGAEDAARAAGLILIQGNSAEDSDIEAAYLRAFGELRVEGLVLTPSPHAGEILRRRIPAHIPVVLLDRRSEGFEADVVRCDTRSATYELSRHLLSLGHKRIALVGGQPIVETWFHRVEGYRRALAEAGLGTSSHLEVQVAHAGLRAFDVGVAAIQELAKLPSMPDAVIASNAQVSIGIVEALSGLGLRVPEDMAVASIDDPIPFSTRADFWGAMTCVVQPGYDMGTRAVELLTERCNGSSVPPRDVLFQAALRIGTSCGELSSGIVRGAVSPVA